MTSEMKNLINIIYKYSSAVGVMIFLVILMIGKSNIAIAFAIGLGVAVINSFLSGIILEKVMLGDSKVLKLIFPFTYLARIIGIVIIAIPFMQNLKLISAYMIGFICYFPILIIGWTINRRRGGSS